MEGITKRYMITIRSPIKLSLYILVAQRIPDTSITLAKPITGAAKNVIFEAPLGTRVSLPRSLIISIKGCRRGGPTRYCTLAVTFLSIQLAIRPTTAVNIKP